MNESTFSFTGWTMSRVNPPHGLLRIWWLILPVGSLVVHLSGVTPQRLVDTRDGTGAPLARVTSTTPLVISVAGLDVTDSFGSALSVPSSVSAVALNMPVVNPSRSGFLTVWPCDTAHPLASNVNYTASQIVANNVIAPIDDNGSICVYTNVPAHVVIDISGWFSGDAVNAFVGSTPVRFIDTRSALGPPPL
jgi:hypothetical protein